MSIPPGRERRVSSPIPEGASHSRYPASRSPFQKRFPRSRRLASAKAIHPSSRDSPREATAGRPELDPAVRRLGDLEPDPQRLAFPRGVDRQHDVRVLGRRVREDVRVHVKVELAQRLHSRRRVRMRHEQVGAEGEEPAHGVGPAGHDGAVEIPRRCTSRPSAGRGDVPQGPASSRAALRSRTRVRRRRGPEPSRTRRFLPGAQGCRSARTGRRWHDRSGSRWCAARPRTRRSRRPGPEWVSSSAAVRTSSAGTPVIASSASPRNGAH